MRTKFKLVWCFCSIAARRSKYSVSAKAVKRRRPTLTVAPRTLPTITITARVDVSGTPQWLLTHGGGESSSDFHAQLNLERLDTYIEYRPPQVYSKYRKSQISGRWGGNDFFLSFTIGLEPKSQRKRPSNTFEHARIYIYIYVYMHRKAKNMHRCILRYMCVYTIIYIYLCLLATGVLPASW